MDPAEHIEPVPYKHDGTTYQEDGIRITGSAMFVDSVLSQLRSLLTHENGQTRLQLVYKNTVDRITGAECASVNCYIQVHERGPEARHINRMFGM